MKKIKEFIYNKKFKITSFVILSIMMAFISTINFDVALYAKNKQNIIVPLSTGTKIVEIKKSNNIYSLKDFKSENIDYEEKENSILAKKDTYIQIETSIIDDISITYNKIASEKDRNIKIGENFYTFSGTQFYKGISKLTLIKDSLTLYSIITFIIFALLIYACFYIIRKVLTKINDDNEKIYDVILIILSEFIICFLTIYTFMFFYKFLAVIPFIIMICIVFFIFKFSINSWSKIYIGLGTVVGIMFLLLIPPRTCSR